MNSTKVVIPIFTLWLSGCAVHPLPQDVTGNTTYHVIQKIRCEARDALTKLAVRGLLESNNPSTRLLAKRLEADSDDDPLNIVQIFTDPNLARGVDPLVHKNFDIMALSAIAFDFTFTGTENNDASAAANLRYPFLDGVFNLNVGAGNTRERQNERKVLVGHTFIELYRNTDREICRQISAGTGNLIYPITGKIGLEEVINTFYLLNRPYNDKLNTPVERHRPVDEAYRNKAEGGDIKDLTDTLMFTTTFNAGATPSVALDPIPVQVFRLADANVVLSARRSDVHKVAISVQKGPAVTSITQALTLAGLQATLPSRRIAKARAFERLDNLRTEDFFKSQRQVRQRLGLPPL
jgi:hypothetical protein